MPSAPGVYLFRGPRDEVLYVGTSGDLRRRVRSYFTSGERRRRVRDMVALAERVDTVVCAHALEAGVRELRLIAAHRPRYNRRSRAPHHAWWVTPTAEAFPRLSVVATPRDGAVGPFRSRQAAAAAVETVLDAVPVRSCTQRIPAQGARASPCALHELGRCAAPCAGLQTPAEYAPAVVAVADLFGGRDDDGPAAARAQASTPTPPASGSRPRPATATGSPGWCWRWAAAQRLAALAAVDELVGARPDGRGGWEIAVVRHGRLAAAGVAARGVPPMPVVDALRAGAQVVLPAAGPLRGAPAEEVWLLLPLAHHRRHPARVRRPAVGRARPQRRGLGGMGAAGAADRLDGEEAARRPIAHGPLPDRAPRATGCAVPRRGVRRPGWRPASGPAMA